MRTLISDEKKPEIHRLKKLGTVTVAFIFYLNDYM